MSASFSRELDEEGGGGAEAAGEDLGDLVGELGVLFQRMRGRFRRHGP